MIAVDVFKGQRVALFGLGGSGLVTAQALMAGGATVVAFDDNATSCEVARSKNITVSNLHNEDWSKFHALILAPGVPLTHPKAHWTVEYAKAHHVEIIGDIELFVRQRNHYLKIHQLLDTDVPFIAITGTNGKSTTTALIDHLLNVVGCDTQMGGNIGTAILELQPFEKGRFYVIECSSFQIDLTPSLNPTVGILLNLTPDHIDRHGDFAHYSAIKARLVAGASYALVSIDDKACADIYETLVKQGHNVLAVCKDHSVGNGLYGQDTKLYLADNGKDECLVDLQGIASLRGQHNAQNALMALGTLHVLGVHDDALQTHLQNTKLQTHFQTYQGLPHRMQLVRKIGHTLFINDSKATNAEASAPALAAFDHIYWIIGGLAKEGGIEALKGFFPKIRKAYLIGEAAQGFAQTIDGAFAISFSGTLDKAVSEAAKDAAQDKADETAVLLSPACASYDQFKNYGARGDAFVQFVNKI